MLRAAGRLPATETMVTPRVRPSLVLRSIKDLATDGAGSGVGSRIQRASSDGHGLQ